MQAYCILCAAFGIINDDDDSWYTQVSSLSIRCDRQFHAATLHSCCMEYTVNSIIMSSDRRFVDPPKLS